MAEAELHQTMRLPSPIGLPRQWGIIALLGVFFLGLPWAWFQDATAGPSSRCSRQMNPVKEIVYDTESMSGIFSFDTKHCFPKGVFVSGVMVDLLQVTTDGHGNVAAWGKICKPNKSCRVKVSLDHPSVEQSKYKFRVFFKASNGRNTRLNIGWMTCTSAVVLARCDS